MYIDLVSRKLAKLLIHSNYLPVEFLGFSISIIIASTNNGRFTSFFFNSHILFTYIVTFYYVSLNV